MKSLLSKIPFALVGLALLVLAPTYAQAEWCTYCDEQIGGCWVHEGPGWYHCENLQDGCLLLEGGCGGGSYASDFLVDGTRPVSDAVLSALEAWEPGARQRETSLGGQLIFKVARDVAGGAVYYRRPCDRSVVARFYDAELSDTLRNLTRTIVI